MSNEVRVAKIGKNAFSEDPNDFIFHSAYNTFKIITQATKSITLAASTNNQSFTQAHGLNFVPLVSAFAKQNGSSRVFVPNGMDVELWGGKAGMIGDVVFNYVKADSTNIIFNFDNDSSSVNVDIRYFCLEDIAV